MIDPRKIAVDVIETEMGGLEALAARLREPSGDLASAFVNAVEICETSKGRVVVTGMGKSGHIARKIAATLASTGTPAVFVHAAEASHGDLGMITASDCILALSYSGETAELRDIVAHAGRFDIPLIAITGGSGSALDQAADVSLILPRAPEATTAAPAPTTSTTMMLALGDALAVAVLRKKGFTESEFRRFHPGGMLGAALQRVRDLMHHTEMPLCEPGDSAADAIAAVTGGGFGCVGVVDRNGALVGMVTDGDLRRHYKILSAARVDEVMTRSPVVVRPDSLAGEVLALFSERKITAVFIVDDAQRPIGLVHVHDCLATGVM